MSNLETHLKETSKKTSKETETETQIGAGTSTSSGISTGAGLSSENLFERSLKVAPGGVHSPVRSFKGLGRTPIFFKEASGATLTSVEGTSYIDFCQSFGPLILGHRDEEVQEAVLEMIHKAWSFGACEPYSLELAEWVTQRIPWIEKLRFVSSGTEAVMSALRLARAFTGREKILKFEGCYHGHVDSLLVKAGSGLAGLAASSSAGISDKMAANTLVVSLDDEEALEQVFLQHGAEIAAVIVEPLPANYGLLIQRKEFLEKVQQQCQRYGALLIFDEVISGFRVALGGMAELLGMKPDLVTYGKVIGGGFPVACYGGRRDIMDQVAPLGLVYQAGTLSANPVGMRAGLVTLQKMEREKGWQILNARAQKWASSLQASIDKLLSMSVEPANRNNEKPNLTLKVAQFGSLFWIHSVGVSQANKPNANPLRRIDQISSQQAEIFKDLFLSALDRGIYLAPNAYEVGFLSLAHTEAILQQAHEGLVESMKLCQNLNFAKASKGGERFL